MTATTTRHDTAFETDRVHDRGVVVERRGTALVHWSGVLSGAAVAVAVLYVLQSFWNALGFGSDIGFFADNLAWWGFASAVVAALVGGLVAGYASGRRSAVAGIISGLTVWGLVLLAASAFDVNAAIDVIIGGQAGADRLGIDNPQWASFASVFGGFVLTALGGMIGGAMAPRDDAIDLT